MYKLLRTVCNASCPEMNSEYKEKRHEITHRLLLNSQIRIHRILRFGATRRSRQGSQEEGTQARETMKKQTLEEEVADTVAHQSLLIPIQISFFGTRNSYSIASSL